MYDWLPSYQELLKKNETIRIFFYYDAVDVINYEEIPAFTLSNFIQMFPLANVNLVIRFHRTTSH